MRQVTAPAPGARSTEAISSWHVKMIDENDRPALPSVLQVKLDVPCSVTQLMVTDNRPAVGDGSAVPSGMQAWARDVSASAQQCCRQTQGASSAHAHGANKPSNKQGPTWCARCPPMQLSSSQAARFSPLCTSVITCIAGSSKGAQTEVRGAI